MSSNDRRSFIKTLSIGTLATIGPGRHRRWAPLRFASDPFPLGIASGDPAGDGFVLWTRLAPEPLQGGGMPPERVAVAWEVARDEGLRQVVRRGTATARPELAHSVHVEVSGLEPDRWYWYRFIAAGETSPIGRARTMLAAGAEPREFRFGFASCQHYEHGYFTALRHLAAEDLGLVVHLGDYIYEEAPEPGAVRAHLGGELLTLADYRSRYALYKTDADLRAAHEAFSWVVTWDDHEVDNNYAGAYSENHDPIDAFLERRAAAYQAFYEHSPIRASTRPKGPNARLYRTVDLGSLARFSVLDTRQYRTDQPCGDRVQAPCPGMFDPASTMMGAEQEKWLRSTFGASRARWNVIAQQVFLAKNDRMPGDGEAYNMDSWNGYPTARQRLLDLIAERGDGNTVVLTGDVHSSWASDLKRDFRDPASPIIGAELVGTSISSGGDGAESYPGNAPTMAENPHIKFHNARRGYVRCAIGPERWTADYRVVPVVTRPNGPVETRTSLVLERGRPGLQDA